jgi:hypothetical protein
MRAMEAQALSLKMPEINDLDSKKNICFRNHGCRQ